MKNAHTPLKEASQYPAVDISSLRELCAHTVAVIMALDTRVAPVKVVIPGEPEKAAAARLKAAEETPLPRPLQLLEDKAMVAHVASALCPVFAKVYALACEHGREIEAALAGTPCELVRIDRAAEEEITRRGHGYDLMTLTKGRLASIAALLGEGADSVMVFNADQPLIRSRHIEQIMERFKDGARPCEAVASWIEWRRVLPLLISRTLIERLTSRHFPRLQSGGQPEIPIIKLVDVVFGEEKLNGYLVLPDNNDEFLASLPYDMPTALTKAHAYLAAGQKARKKPEPLEAQVQSAIEVLANIAEAAASLPAEELRHWNAWAQRNRLDFPLLNTAENESGLVYLDSAATTQRPLVVMDALAEYGHHSNANIWRGYYRLANDSTKAYEQARARVAGFIGAKPEQLFFTANTTAGINEVAQIWGWQQLHEGDLIVAGISEHHSNLLPWYLLRDRLGVRIAFIPYDKDGRYDQRAYRELLEQKPKLVSFAAMGNTLGIMAPVKKMARMAHAAGARVCLDAAQGFAHAALDVGQLGVDFMAFSAHKAYGPFAIGGLYVADDVLDEVDVAALGGGSVSHVGEDDYYLRTVPTAYEAGTPAIEQAVGFAKAVDYLEALGMEDVEAHARMLSQYLIAAMGTIPEVVVVGDHTKDDGACGLVSFKVSGINCLNVTKSLGELGIATRGGSHCAMPLTARMGSTGSLRISLGVYNTIEDIDALVLALSYVVEHYRGVEPRP